MPAPTAAPLFTRGATLARFFRGILSEHELIDDVLAECVLLLDEVLAERVLLLDDVLAELVVLRDQDVGLVAFVLLNDKSQSVSLLRDGESDKAQLQPCSPS